jgi:lantibiotic biosynthesis protein
MVASRSLCARSASWDPLSEASKSIKVQHALMRYFARMTSRCTPFGLFAGVSWATYPGKNEPRTPTGIYLQGSSAYRRHCRLDMQIIADIEARLLSDEAFRYHLSYFLNPSLCKRGSRWRYLESKSIGKARRFEWSVVEATPYLDSLLSEIDGSDIALSFNAIAETLGRIEPGADTSEIRAFVDSLITEGILLSTLHPPLTLGDPADHIRAALKDCPTSWALEAIDALQERIDMLARAPIGFGAESIEALDSQAKGLFNIVDARDPVQIDLIKPIAGLDVPPSLLSGVQNSVVALLALSPPAPRRFDSFCRAFFERYGEAEIPLLDALDPDSGIPFDDAATDDVPLIDGLPLNNNDTEPMEDASLSSPASAVLVRKFEEACRSGSRQINFTSEEIEALLESRSPSLPESFFVMVSLLQPTAVTGEFAKFCVKWAGGSTGAQLLGRFCAGDAGLTDRVKGYLEKEGQYSAREAVYAEIVYWPVGRVGNVILRPQLRSNEIPIFGRSGVPKAHQILLRELFISIRNKEIILRCPRLGKRIIPRLTCSHNVQRNSAGVYKFLANLQYQEKSLTTFRWPQAMYAASRLPRVIYGDAILSPETWYLRADRLGLLRSCSESEGFDIVQKWRSQDEWPRFIELLEGDNFLCIDLDNPVSVDCLVTELKGTLRATVREFFIPGESGFAQGPEGTFCNEIIFPFLSIHDDSAEKAKLASVRETRGPTSGEASGAHIPFGRWMYLKIYCGAGESDTVLRKHIGPLMTNLTDSKLATKWFFLRYHDRGPHLRVRVEGEQSALWGQAIVGIREVLAQISAERLARDIEIGSYEPEYDRYGGMAAISLAERVFHLDSEVAMALIAGEGFRESVLRWKWIAYRLDIFWRTAGYSEQERAVLYARSAEGYRARFGATKATKIWLDGKFRETKNSLAQLMFDGVGGDGATRTIVESQSVRLEPALRELRELAARGVLTRSLEEILRSHAHMLVNRLCVSSNTTQEYVVYEFLARLLAGRVARAESVA